MNILLFTILTGGLLVFLSQTSYARVIATVDFTTAERRVHGIHHTAHAFCGILAMLMPSPSSFLTRPGISPCAETSSSVNGKTRRSSDRDTTARCQSIGLSRRSTARIFSVTVCT